MVPLTLDEFRKTASTTHATCPRPPAPPPPHTSARDGALHNHASAKREREWRRACAHLAAKPRPVYLASAGCDQRDGRRRSVPAPRPASSDRERPAALSAHLLAALFETQATPRSSSCERRRPGSWNPRPRRCGGEMEGGRGVLGQGKARKRWMASGRFNLFLLQSREWFVRQVQRRQRRFPFP